MTVTNSVYPVYVDSNIMAGKIGLIYDDGRSEEFIYLPFSEKMISYQICQKKK